MMTLNLSLSSGGTLARNPPVSISTLQTKKALIVDVILRKLALCADRRPGANP